MWLTSKEATKHYDVSADTLRRYEQRGDVTTFRTPANHRRYWNVLTKDETDNDRELQESTKHRSENVPDSKRKTILYARVSTRNQKLSLSRQIEELKRYADYNRIEEYEIVSDIGSGINFKRRGLKTILDTAETGTLKSLVVTHKDRLARFSYDLLEDVLARWKVDIDVVCKENEERSSEEELADDLLTIVHVFSARSNGKKRYNKVFENQSSSEKGDKSSVEDVV
jgi:predicted site-specific integrase-resolvase